MSIKILIDLYEYRYKEKNQELYGLFYNSLKGRTENLVLLDILDDFNTNIKKIPFEKKNEFIKELNDIKDMLEKKGIIYNQGKFNSLISEAEKANSPAALDEVIGRNAATRLGNISNFLSNTVSDNFRDIIRGFNDWCNEHKSTCDRAFEKYSS